MSFFLENPLGHFLVGVLAIVALTLFHRLARALKTTMVEMVFDAFCLFAVLAVVFMIVRLIGFEVTNTLKGYWK